jgi:hypothetical protein
MLEMTQMRVFFKTEFQKLLLENSTMKLLFFSEIIGFLPIDYRMNTSFRTYYCYELFEVS